MDNIDRLRARRPEEFAAMVDKIRKAGTDNLSHFGNGYVLEGGYSLQQNPDEFASLVLMLMHDTHTQLLEIGSASGGTARFLYEHCAVNEVLSIDDGGHHRYPELAGNFANLRVYHFKGDSHSAPALAWLTQHASPGDIDVAFIDGDHSAEGVWKDVELVMPFLRHGARIIFHDTVACEGVKQAWQRGAREGLWVMLGEYIGKERPLGIGLGYVL